MSHPMLYWDGMGVEYAYPFTSKGDSVWDYLLNLHLVCGWKNLIAIKYHEHHTWGILIQSCYPKLSSKCRQYVVVSDYYRFC